MKRLMSITIALLFVFTLVFVAQVAETQAQMHIDDDHMVDSPWGDDDHMNDDDYMIDYPWDDDQINDYPCDDYMADFPWGDDHMAGFPWIDDDHMDGSLQYNMPALFWMYYWMWYMMLFMGPGV